MGRGPGDMTYFSNFGTPNISGTAKDTNLKICMLLKILNQKKIGKKRA